MKLRSVVGTVVLLLLPVPFAAAHNLFLHVERQPEGPDLIDVFFEHSPFPGKGEYNDPIVRRGRTWVRTLENEPPTPHTLEEITRRGKKFLQGETGTKAPRVIEHACKWGVYRGRLDYFYGKYLDVQTVEQAKRLGRAPKLPLDLVPRPEAAALRVQVLWQGEPQANATVWTWPPGGGERKLQADGKGIVTVEDAKPGLYAFATVLTRGGEQGEFDGQAYDGVMHGVTLTLPWPLK